MSQHTIRGHRAPRTDDNPIPMVMAHGTGMDITVFLPLAKSLAPRECIRPEYIGYPRGGPLPDGPSLDADATTVETAIAELGRPVHLFGHSYGGRVALEVARRGNVELETLIVFEPVVQGALEPREMGAFLDVTDGYDPFLERLTDYWGGPGTWNSLPPNFQALQRRRAARIHLEVTGLSSDRVPASAWSSLTMPVLVMRGDYGHTDSETMCQALVDAIPTAELVVVPESNHMAPILDAVAVGVAIRTWLGLR